MINDFEKLRGKLHEAIDVYGLDSEKTNKISRRYNELVNDYYQNERQYHEDNLMYIKYLESIQCLRKITKDFMKFPTTNEWNHFGFQEAYISEIQKVNGGFQFTLDNVTIEPDNSKNRDIRQMRANELYVTIQDAEIERLVEEGYKVYNANGQLMEQYEDRDIASENYNEILKSLTDGESCIYALEKKDDVYIFTIDASSERTYVLYMKGTRDIEQWNRFLNK